MHPVLFEFGGVSIGTHDVFVLLGAAVAAGWFALECRRRFVVGDPRLWWIVGGALVGGGLFARLSTAVRYIRAAENPSVAGLLLYGGKSLLGGLVGAYVGVLVAKRLVGYRSHTGDLFAPAVALGLAVGRVGCFLTEQVGTPTSLPWGISVSSEVAARIPGCSAACREGRPMHPSLLYEIAFLLALFAALSWLRGRVGVPGELFKIFLVAYGTGRFLLEFVRGNEVFAWGLTGSQMFLLVTLPVGYGYLARQLARHAYHRPPVSPGGPVALPSER
jgi:prolipoprotein diacylglyceryltransferase